MLSHALGRSLFLPREDKKMEHDKQAAGDHEDSGFRHPLPQFLPQATFDDLDAADVIIQLPGRNREPEFLGVDHALFETCPGRASKRYSLRPGDPDGLRLQR